MSKTSMLLRSILPILAVTFLSLPQAANANQVCPFPILGTDCTLTVTTPVDPDATVICPQGETVYQLSFSVQCAEGLCYNVPNPILVCGAWNTDLNLSICGNNYTLDLKKAWRWRDAYTDCGKLQLN